jgi:hypothetical protein
MGTIGCAARSVRSQRKDRGALLGASIVTWVANPTHIEKTVYAVAKVLRSATPDYR